jgi:hypothetical protein
MAFGHGDGRGKGQNGEEGEGDRFPTSPGLRWRMKRDQWRRAVCGRGGTEAAAWGARERDGDGWGGAERDIE